MNVYTKCGNNSTELILGAIAGALGQVFTIPVSVVATRQQLSSSETHQSLYETAMEVLREDGFTGLWRGLKASLVLTVVRQVCQREIRNLMVAAIRTRPLRTDPSKD